MIRFWTETIKIEKVQYVCDKCGIKTKRMTKEQKHLPSGWISTGFLQHLCPMCASRIDNNKRVEAAMK